MLFSGSTFREQTYPSHIGGVMEGVYRNALGFAPFISHERFAIYLRILLEGGEFHDLGKLDLDNQAVLDGRVSLPHLPVEHRDAGVHYLMTQLENRHAAALVHSHHRPGLPNLLEERASRDPFRFASVKEATDKKLAQYLELHKREMEGVRRRVLADAALPLPKRLDALEYRMLLSCLVDADYSDAGGEAEEPSCGNPRWKERLDSLNAYVQDLGAKAKHPDSVRNQLRQRFYLESLEAAISSFLEYCDAPVGSGKTTAILAHILKLAYHFNLRHIFVVVPFTNIITQTVRELKKALRLPDEENANLVVAEHHHNADFDSLELRHLSTTWRLPVIVTTAVQFFETLASNVPSKLRKLHQLPGSAVIIDESHAALPAPLMPLAWKWMDELTEHWGCRFCLCSGTSFRFWSLPAFTSIAAKEVTPLLSEDLTNQLSDHERERVNLRAYDGEASHFSGAGALVNHIEKMCIRDSLCGILWEIKTLHRAVSPDGRKRGGKLRVAAAFCISDNTLN